MKTYDVTIRATVTKTIRVEAQDEQEAIMEAHGEFDVTCTNEREKYDEETMNIKEVAA
jgi:hypothetical protein